MLSDTLRATINELKAKRKVLDEAIEALESAADAETGASSASRSRRRGRPAGKGSGKDVRAPRGRKRRRRARRGELREAMYKALRRASRPLTPAEVRDRVIAGGYPSSNPKTLYVSVFGAINKDPHISKTEEGVFLASDPSESRERAAGAGAKRTKRRTSKKAGVKKKSNGRKKPKARKKVKRVAKRKAGKTTTKAAS